MASELFKTVKDHVSISTVIGSYIDLKKSGRGYTGLCPFHGEKTPSFHVDESKGFYHCFGCKASGDVIKFVEEYEKLSPVDAAKFIAEKYGVNISGQIGGNYKKKNDGVLEVLNATSVLYTKFFWESVEAKKYAAERGIPKEVIMSFRIGYAPNDSQKIYQELEKNFSEKQLLKAGVIAEHNGRYFDSFRGRLIFPIIDQRDRVLGFGGRAMGNSQPKYLNSSESKYFQKSELLYGLNIAKNKVKEQGYVIVTEGYMDVVSLYTAGVRNAVATLGTSMTAEHAALISNYTDTVVVCYDSDSAGIKSAIRSVDILMPHIETVKVCLLGESLDPDEFIKKYGKKVFDQKIKEAKLGVDFKIDQMATHFNLNDHAELNKFLRQAVQEIQKVKDPLDRVMFAENLSSSYNVDVGIIKKMANAYARRDKPEIVNIVEEQDVLTLDELLIKHFAKNASAYAEQPELLEKVLTYPFNESDSELFYGLVSYFEEYDELSLSAFAADAGIEAGQRLEKIINSKQEEKNVEMILRNREVQTLKEQLSIAMGTSDMQKIQELSMEIKRKVEEINTLMLKGW